MTKQEWSKRVMYWDDERNLENGIIVTLNYGWEFEEDPGCCVRGFDTVKEAENSIRNARQVDENG